MKQKRSKTPRSFNSRKIANDLHELLMTDLGYHPAMDDYSNSYIEQEYCSYGDASRFYRDYQSISFLKKFKGTSKTDPSLDAPTYKKFLKVCDHLLELNNHVNLPDCGAPFYGRISQQDSKRDRILKRSRFIFREVLGNLDLFDVLDACKHSGGSSQGVPFVDTTLERKWEFPLSITADAVPLMNLYFAYDKVLYDAVLKLNADAIANGVLQYKIVEGSVATTVPKNNLINRMIGIEATCNMFLQQGIMYLLCKRLKLFGLDFQFSQDHHRFLAMIASVTAKLATVDFSSASDTVLTNLISWYCKDLPWFGLLDCVRSKVLTIPSYIDGGVKIESTTIQLPMISTMGNATTFPIETLVFFSLAVACNSRTYNGNSLLPQWDDLKEFSVFGDDCILPTSCVDDFLEIARSVGFLINDKKTFTSAKWYFRESCGGDYFHGRNVRPVFLGDPVSEKVSSLAPWLYITMNGLIKKYISYFGDRDYVYGRTLFRYIFSLFAKYEIQVRIVPGDHPDDSGLQYFDDLERFLINNVHKNTKYSKILVDCHGTSRFSYHKFVYNLRSKCYVGAYDEFGKKLTSRERQRRRKAFLDYQIFMTDDYVRYSTLLKTFTDYQREWKWFLEVQASLMSKWEERTDGGYVVGSGSSFMLPALKH